MGFPQIFERKFKADVYRFLSLGLVGFGSMSLAVWEQILPLFALALPNGGTGGVLLAYLIVAGGFSLIITSLADMARRFPTSAGPFYRTAVLHSTPTTSRLSHLMSWLCAFMSILGLSINLIVNMIFTTDVAIFLSTLAGKNRKFIYHSEELKNRLRVPWALPVTIGITILVGLIFNWRTSKDLPRLHICFAIMHWFGFLAFVIAIPVVCHNSVGLSSTV